MGSDSIYNYGSETIASEYADDKIDVSFGLSGDSINSLDIYEKDSVQEKTPNTESLSALYDSPKIIKVKKYRLYKK